MGRRAHSLQMMPTVTFVLALLGAGLSLLTFYLTQLRPPRIQGYAERRVRLGYVRGGPGFTLYVPLTFVNRAQRTGVVHRVALVLEASDGDEPAFCIELSRFAELDAGKTEFKDVGLPQAFAVPGNASVGRLARFTWWNDSQPRLVLAAAPYRLAILIWTAPAGPPSSASRHRLHLSAAEFAALDASRARADGAMLEVVLDGGERGNRLLARIAVRRLLGSVGRATTPAP